MPDGKFTSPGPSYVPQGEMVFELEGEPARVVRAGEAFWEPGKPMLTFVDEQELAKGKNRRAPRAN